MNKALSSIEDIYKAIAAEGFCEQTLQLIDEQVNNIQNGTEDFSRFNLSEHAGLCKGGAPLIGASIITCNARRSLTASCDAESSKGERMFSSMRSAAVPFASTAS